MKYTAKDFKKKRGKEAGTLVSFRVTPIERKSIDESTHRLNTNVSTLVRRCLRDAGVMKSKGD